MAGPASSDQHPAGRAPDPAGPSGSALEPTAAGTDAEPEAESAGGAGTKPAAAEGTAGADAEPVVFPATIVFLIVNDPRVTTPPATFTPLAAVERLSVTVSLIMKIAVPALPMMPPPANAAWLLLNVEL